MIIMEYREGERLSGICLMQLSEPTLKTNV